MDTNITTGIDIIEIARVKSAVNCWQAAFLNRVFTPCELKICGLNTERLAGRFAAKEAVLKALSYQSLICNWHEIEILAQDNGRPLLKLHGKAFEEFDKLGFVNMDISLSHSRDYAVAVAVGQCQ